jgi:hypothetical protein
MAGVQHIRLAAELVRNEGCFRSVALISWRSAGGICHALRVLSLNTGAQQ